METVKGKAFFGGVPTEADVNILMNYWDKDSFVSGAVIKYEDVAALLNKPVKSARFKTVTSVWRKKLENLYNVLLKCDAIEQQFVVLTEGGKVELSRSKVKSAAVSARRACTVAATVDLKKLSESEYKSHVFSLKQASDIISVAQVRTGNHTPDFTSNAK